MPTDLDESPTHGPSRAGEERLRVTLHEEIAAVLQANGNRRMTTNQIAEAVKTRRNYVKCDGTSGVTAFHVHGRTRNYSGLFERYGSRVRLRRE